MEAQKSNAKIVFSRNSMRKEKRAGCTRVTLFLSTLISFLTRSFHYFGAAFSPLSLISHYRHWLCHNDMIRIHEKLGG
jgi:hypothetical protein